MVSSIKKTGLFALLLTLFLCFLPSCSQASPPSLCLSKELSSTSIELTSLPWQSEVSLALEHFQLDANRYTVKEIDWAGGKSGLWGLQIGFPVHWEDMDCDASLLLTYRCGDGQTAEGLPTTHLCRIGLTVFFPDDRARDACVENAAAMLEALAEKEPVYPLPDRWKYQNERGESQLTAEDLYTIGTGVKVDGYACELRTRKVYHAAAMGYSEGLQMILSATPEEEVRPNAEAPYGVVGWD